MSELKLVPKRLNESQEARESLPIKAWGSVMRTYYGYPTISLSGEIKIHTPPNSNSRNATSITLLDETPLTSIECIQDGLFIRSQITDRCPRVMYQTILRTCTKVSSHPFIFPNSVAMYDHMASIKVWTNGTLFMQHDYPAKRIQYAKHYIAPYAGNE